MGSALHLLLLSLCVGMIHGDGFTVKQPGRLEGVEGGWIDIPCTFTYPDTHTPTGYDIAWRRNEFHGEFIFNMSLGYTHPEYRGRIQFLGDPAKERTGTIRIKQLRTRDTNRYFCRVAITGNRYALWQSVPGTYLTVRAWRPETTTDRAPSSVSAASQRSVDGGDPLPQGLILIIKAGFALTILVTVWLVGMCLMNRKEVTDSSDGN
ncbi:paired immunoglobulin-like type 2 receptor beta [Hemiscyllium ocellatum]|uniref:paired immunoglobulin-like type 2 receptor beta n=1 Tax=Hemiscyllium ocellatum TaxID=170820 RepID=UPI00296736F8|nr:paired immunoglobulin-like type 2 receptor beta [Hemiscyllium ocellatum]